MDDREKINFIYKVANTGAIAIAGTWQVDLSTIQQNYGNNYNAIVVQNLHNTDGVDIQFDGITTKRIPLSKNGGFLNLSYDDKLVYSQVEIVNSSGVEIPINAIQISIIRAGN
jgi:hypothetical protein